MPKWTLSGIDKKTAAVGSRCESGCSWFSKVFGGGEERREEGSLVVSVVKVVWCVGLCTALVLFVFAGFSGCQGRLMVKVVYDHVCHGCCGCLRFEFVEGVRLCVGLRLFGVRAVLSSSCSGF